MTALDPTPSIIAAMPGAYASAEKASKDGQHQAHLFTAISLALLVAAAIFGAIDQAWTGLAAAGAFVASLALTAASKKREGAWYDGRAVAETIKSLTFKYAVGGAPFAVDDGSAPSRYNAALREFGAQMQALGSGLDAADGADAVTVLHALRASEQATRRDAYRTQRVRDQMTYYRQRGTEHGTAAGAYQAIAAVLQVLGVVGAVLKFADVTHVDLLGLLAAGAASITAWNAFGDYTKTARAYRLAVIELEAIEHMLEPMDEHAWATFVADAEQAMSREHTAWVARRRAI